MDRVDAHINQITEMGFLRRLRGTENQFEVRRILKAFVDAQWLSELDQRLAIYRDHATGGDANVLTDSNRYQSFRRRMLRRLSAPECASIAANFSTGARFMVGCGVLISVEKTRC